MESLEAEIERQFQALANKPCFGSAQTPEYPCGICAVSNECAAACVESVVKLEKAIDDEQVSATLAAVAVENKKVATMAFNPDMEELKRPRVPFDFAAATSWMIETKPPRLSDVAAQFLEWLGHPDYKATAYGNAGKIITKLVRAELIEYDGKKKVITWK